jgi:hypothetical protein
MLTNIPPPPHTQAGERQCPVQQVSTGVCLVPAWQTFWPSATRTLTHTKRNATLESMTDHTDTRLTQASVHNTVTHQLTTPLLTYLTAACTINLQTLPDTPQKHLDHNTHPHTNQHSQEHASRHMHDVKSREHTWQ